MRTGRQRANFGHLHFAIDMQERVRVHAAQIYACAVYVNHIDLVIVNSLWAHCRARVESVAGPLIVLPCQMESPDVCFPVQIENEQTIEARGCQENRLIHTADFVAMLQISVLMGVLNREATVITKKFVACGDVDIVTIEGDATQAPVGAATFEVYSAVVPVYVLHDFLFFKIDRKYAAVTFALLTAAHDRCCNEFWKSNRHALVVWLRQHCTEGSIPAEVRSN